MAKIEKHRQDIFALAEALPAGLFPLPQNMANVAQEAFSRIATSFQTDSEPDVLTMLRNFYQLS